MKISHMNDIQNPQAGESCGATDATFLVNRRQFLFGAGAVVTMLSMPGWMVRRGVTTQPLYSGSDCSKNTICSNFRFV